MPGNGSLSQNISTFEDDSKVRTETAYKQNHHTCIYEHCEKRICIHLLTYKCQHLCQRHKYMYIYSVFGKTRKSTNEVNQINGWIVVAICKKTDLLKKSSL